MQSNSFIKNFLFTKENGKLKVNVSKTIIAFFAVILIGAIIYNLRLFVSPYYFEPYYFLNITGEFVLAVAVAICVFSILKFFGSHKSLLDSLNKDDIRTVSIILFIAIFTILILFAIVTGRIFKSPGDIVGAIIVAALFAGAVYFIGNKLLKVEALSDTLTRKNHYLSLVVGYICIFFFPLGAIGIGIYQYTRKDNEYSKIYGISLIVFSIIILIMFSYINMLLSYY